MFNKLKFAAGLAVVVTILGLIAGLSLKHRPVVESIEIPGEVAAGGQRSSVSTAVDIQQTGFGPDTNPIPEMNPGIEDDENHILLSGANNSLEDLALLDSLDFSDVRDVEIDFDRALLATAGGVLEFFTDDSSFAIYSYPQELHNYDSYAVLTVNDDILVGTSAGVYLIDIMGMVQPVWSEITDTITALENVEGCIYVGTRHQGLFEVNGNIVTRLLADKNIIAVSQDQFALWCATAEDGLLYHDGNGWHKRQLLNNPDAFDTVTALESAFGKLWVGTPNGLYIFNGDNWEHVDTADYLYEDQITALAAGRSYMYIGTAHEGVFAYYNGWLSPLDWSDNLPVRSLDVYDGKYLVGLDKGGAILNSRKGVLDILPLVRQSQGILSIL